MSDEQVFGDGSATSRTRVCTFHYSASGRQQQSPQKQQQGSQQQQQQQQQSDQLRMPSNREMPSFEEWKRRRANRPFGQEVVLLELDPKEELARRKQRDQRLMSLMQPEEQDKFYTYLDHYDRLQTKVERDREERERSKAEAAREASAKAAARKKEQHKLHKRLDKVDLATDSQFVADVAKSKYYRLVQREQKRQFRSRDDQDQFWLGELQTEGLLRPMEMSAGRQQRRHVAGTSGPGAGPGAAVGEGQQLADDQEQQPALQWEKTDDTLFLGASRTAGARSGGGFHGMTRAQQNRMLDELFPRAERPKLTSFDVDYSKKEEKSADELELERLQERRRKRLDEWREHRHMQQMAVTFGVATRRILDERPVRDSADRLMDEAEADLGQLFGGALERARRREQLELESRRGGGGSGELDLTDPRLLQSWRRRPAGQRRKSRHGGADGISSTTTFSSAQADAAAGGERPLTTPATQTYDDDYDDGTGYDDRRRRTQRPLLSLADAHKELPRIEAKGQSTLWNNYLGAGNVRFAPLDDDAWYRESTTAAATG